MLHLQKCGFKYCINSFWSKTISLCCFQGGVGSLCHVLHHLQIEMHQPVCTFIWACNCVSSAGEHWFIKAQERLGSSTVLLIALVCETCKCEIKQKCTLRALRFLLEPQKWSHLGIKSGDSSWNWWRLWPKTKVIFWNWRSFISRLPHLQNNCTKMGGNNRDFSKNGQTF